MTRGGFFRATHCTSIASHCVHRSLYHCLCLILLINTWKFCPWELNPSSELGVIKMQAEYSIGFHSIATTTLFFLFFEWPSMAAVASQCLGFPSWENGNVDIAHLSNGLCSMFHKLKIYFLDSDRELRPRLQFHFMTMTINLVYGPKRKERGWRRNLTSLLDTDTNLDSTVGATTHFHAVFLLPRSVLPRPFPPTPTHWPGFLPPNYLLLSWTSFKKSHFP